MKVSLRGRGQGVTHLKDFRKADIVGKAKIGKEQQIQWNGDKVEDLETES